MRHALLTAARGDAAVSAALGPENLRRFAESIRALQDAVASPEASGFLYRKRSLAKRRLEERAVQWLSGFRRMWEVERLDGAELPSLGGPSPSRIRNVVKLETEVARCVTVGASAAGRLRWHWWKRFVEEGREVRKALAAAATAQERAKTAGRDALMARKVEVLLWPISSPYLHAHHAMNGTLVSAVAAMLPSTRIESAHSAAPYQADSRLRMRPYAAPVKISRSPTLAARRRSAV